MLSKDLSESNFLGTGWGFPPAFNKHKKSVEMISGEEDIMSSLEILFSTSIGERIMRIKYGSQVPSMVFEPLDSSQRASLSSHVMRAIILYEPRIKPLDVRVDMDYLEGKVTISVDFSVVTTNNRRNFVYPFYIIEGTEVRK